ncbi:MAG: PAS domain S-box protein [Chloroflexi bacterium]|nr:PAS domain S-box protein [Chloroflexota bacterium]
MNKKIPAEQIFPISKLELADLAEQWGNHLEQIGGVRPLPVAILRSCLNDMVLAMQEYSTDVAYRAGGELAAVTDSHNGVLSESQFFISRAFLGKMKEMGREDECRPKMMWMLGEFSAGFNQRVHPIALFASEDLQAMFEAAPAAVLFVDEQGRMVHANPKTALLFGYARHELIGYPVERLIPSEFHATHQNHRADYMSHPTTRLMGANLALHGLRQDGTRFPIDVGLSVVHTLNGRLVMCIIKDLSAEQTAENMLRHSQKFLEGVLNNLTAHVVIVDEAGVILSVNEAWREFGRANGLTWPDYGLGRNYFQVLADTGGEAIEDAQAILAGIQQVLQGELESYSHTYACHTPTTQAWYTLQATCFASEEGLRLVLAYYDVTESILVEAELYKAKAFLSSVLELVPVSIYTMNLDEKFHSVNQQWEFDTQVKREDAIGRTLHEVFPPTLAQHCQRDNKWVAQNGLLVIDEAAETPHGLRWYHTIKFPLHNAKGKVEFVGGLALDITDRKQVEQALQESEERFRHVFEQAAVGMYLLDLDSRILQANPAFCAMLGYLEVELTNVAINTITHPDDISLGQRARERARAGHVHEYMLEKRYLNKQGEAVWSHVTASLVHNQQGHAQYFIAVVVDVDERRKIEASLRHTQKLESIGILAGGIAHDFNNLLSALMAENTLALLKLADGHMARPHLKKSLHVIERAANLTRQLLTYAGKERFERKPLELNLIIEDNLSLLEAILPYGVTLQHHLAPLPLIEADAGQMQQVVMNLIINAAESYEGREGEVMVQTLEVQLTKDANLQHSHGLIEPLTPGQYVCLRVQDSGKGMDPHTAARIFEPFFTTKITGRGLGLAAVRDIMTTLGGAMGVQSQLGVGTTFELFFPIHQPDPSKTLPTDLSSSTPQGQILLADDEEVIRSALGEMLNVAGLEVLMAENGEEALEKFMAHQENIAAVIVDIHMPGLNGEQVLERLLEMAPQTPIILMSGYNSTQINSDWLKRPNIVILKKPFGFQQLVQAIETVCAVSAV